MTLNFAPEAIEHWPIGRLIPYAANARRHDDRQVALLANSLIEYGWLNPCLVDDAGILIAGHGRVMAARQIGLETIPVIRVSHLTPEQTRAYRIADNKLTEIGGWDEELLAQELQALNLDDFPLEGLGFTDAELDELLPAFGEEGGEEGKEGSDEGEDEVPEAPQDPATRPGDLWVLGQHRLLCGDATRAVDLERLMDGRMADLCFTDPPYNVDYAGGAAAERSRILNDALGEGFEQFLHDASRLIIAHTAGAIYVCMSSSELHTLQKAFVAAGGHWSTFIIWAKDRFTLGRSDYQRQFEPILYGWPEGTSHHWCGARDQGDVWFVNRPPRSELHPTMKPLALVARAIHNSSPRGGLVLDPFGGSGTTLIAAQRTGRVARLVELDPRYCDVIVERWQRAAGREAIIDGTEQTFAQVKAERLDNDSTADAA